MKISYRIDGEDRIIATGGDWDGFARANGGAPLQGAAVLGRPLASFVAGEAVQAIYGTIIRHVRGGRSLSFRYRCDAPETRREFEMRVSPGPTGEVEFESTLVSETARPAVAWFRHNLHVSDGLVRICSWCHAVATRSATWIPLEEALESRTLLEPQHRNVTHGMCPGCKDAMMARLNGSGVRTVGAAPADRQSAAFAD